MTLAAQTQPPPLLLICTEPLKPGHEAEYRRVEIDTAHKAVSLGCPHPYLAAESLDGAKQMWWFNGFDSIADHDRVGKAYEANQAWWQALTANQKRKAPFTLPTKCTLTRYRADLSRGPAWTVGEGRFLVIATFHGEPPIEGTVFEADDGTHFVIREVKSDNEGRKLAGARANAVAIRPELSFASPDWIARDPQFWQARAHASPEKH